MKRILAIFVCMLLALPVLGIAEETASGGDLIVGMVGEPYSLNSWTSNDLNSGMIANLLYPGQVTFNENAEKVPYMLESYAWDDDTLMSATLKLREGFYWHDGEPLTGEDLAFTINTCVNKTVNFGSDYYSNVDHAEVLEDGYTVKVYMKTPQVNMLTKAGYWVDIMPEHLLRDVEDFATCEYPTIGYGPFKLEDYSQGEYYTFSAVKGWGEPFGLEGPYLDTLTVRIYADANSAVLALLSGEIEAITSTLAVSLQNQVTNAGEPYAVATVPSLGFGYFGFSYANELLADNVVRKAIAQCIDRDALINIAIEGGGVKMETPISPVYSTLVEGAATFPALDVEAANAELEAAGYIDRDGDGIRESESGDPLSFALTCRNNTSNIDAISNIFKANCAEIGVNIDINIVDPATYTDLVTKQKTFDINYIEWGVIEDCDMGMTSIYHSTATMNFMQYQNDEIDALLDEISATADADTRLELTYKFQEAFVEELPVVSVLVRTNAYAYSNANYTGWSLKPGLYGVCDAESLLNVHAVQ
ncbi:MAG TPA: ABC transporter substrate-binding protein [Candidatus Pullichristensenella stercorigallinarum]|uniref:ABC transporter substrate-binding protein n=1 Tax=Candidatus Pullichristensenella stercorigallinarum TaxID=2840909 RepID=A0A9D0ZN15_9FIRM|nr:ABC transporter substrate-binding protein [Candidatus Pullichristensenella stercorigallinarum]